MIDTEQTLDSKIKTTVVLGGSFDPPHLGHALMAASLFEALPHLNVEAVTLVPSPPRWDKNQKSSKESRKFWTQLLSDWLQSLGYNVAASTIEIDKPQFFGTYETLKELKSLSENLTLNLRNSQSQLALALGSDSYSYLPKWHNEKTNEPSGLKVIKEFPCIVFCRNENNNEVQLYPHSHLMSCVLPHLNSPNYFKTRKKLGISESADLLNLSSSAVRTIFKKWNEEIISEKEAIDFLGKCLPVTIFELLSKNSQSF